MDTSEKYILMCSKAYEIQKLCKWVGDENSFILEEESFERRGSQVWLPRQDQLQEIALTSVVGRNWDTLRFFIEKTATSYFIGFDSFEKLWLSFVMQRKFNKVWSEEKQDWINN